MLFSDIFKFIEGVSTINENILTAYRSHPGGYKYNMSNRLQIHKG